LEGKESPISFESAYYSSLMTIKIANDFKIWWIFKWSFI
jgi:hypothetical protein